MNDKITENDIISKWDNTRISDVEEVISPMNIISEYPLDQDTANFIDTSRLIISNIINLEDDRLLVITGPCSIHNPEEALQIAEELKEL